MHPKIWEGEKTSKIRGDFGQISTLIANISEMDRQIENRRSSWSTTAVNPSHVGRKKTVNFGPQTKKLLMCILNRPTGHFSGDYISALRGCCALKNFLRVRDWQRLVSAHPNWEGVPPNFNPEKNSLKIWRVCVNISSKLMAVSSKIIIQTTCASQRW